MGFGMRVVACDLCYRRRIKCDGQKPRCSHCVIYNSDCTRKTAARKPARKRGPSNSREAALEARVKSLEGQLSTALGKLEAQESPYGPETSPSALSPSRESERESIPLSNPGPDHNPMPLDSLHDILPVIEWYLATSNYLVPLFDPSHLLTSVKDWFHKPHAREPSVWAMINVVLALAHHSGYSGKKTRSINDTTYIKNAQSVLTDAIAHNTTLTHVQVLIGLSMLFRTANEPTPAVVFIATAIRLAHKLGLHRRSSGLHDPTLCLQRHRVFWIAYILDRSISSQTRISPVQLDSDIDLDLPPLTPLCDDLGGFVVTDNRHPTFSFLRASVQMARIQGLVHQYVYSASAQTPNSIQEANNITFIHRELDAWTAQIPPDFHPAALRQSGGIALSRHFCMLYSARLSCRAIISYGSIHDSFHYSNWVGGLRDYGERVAAGQVVSRIADQQGWTALVDESRDYLSLFMTFQSRDAIFTMTTLCAYITSLICLVANNMSNAQAGIRVLDDTLIESAVSPLRDIVKETGNLHQTYDALQGLISYTHALCRHQGLQRSSVPSESPWGTGSGTLDSEILHYLFTAPQGEPLWDLQNPGV
ncbi:hypothetical protein ANO14919_066170 [Xylariales sp. No.14919]|nr:hypothetical protein ANO14919_066170 [Xylariales sp. No.14919]